MSSGSANPLSELKMKLVVILLKWICESPGARNPVLTAPRKTNGRVGCHRSASLPEGLLPKSL